SPAERAPAAIAPDPSTRRAGEVAATRARSPGAARGRKLPRLPAALAPAQRRRNMRKKRAVAAIRALVGQPFGALYAGPGLGESPAPARRGSLRSFARGPGGHGRRPRVRAASAGTRRP